MSLIEEFISELHYYLTGSKNVSGNIIRKHSKRLRELGEISFPLKISSWVQVVARARISQDSDTIFNVLYPGKSLDCQVDELITDSQNWSLEIIKYLTKNDDIHLFLNVRKSTIACFKTVFYNLDNYGFDSKLFRQKIVIERDSLESDNSKINLTDLRSIIIQDVVSNIAERVCFESKDLVGEEIIIQLTQKNNHKETNEIVCGPILNENGIKDTTTMALALIKKRSVDMELMALHKYGLRIKAYSDWVEFFERMGKACVTIEMLQTKVFKPLKISLNKLQTSNKGPAFIFYNCARLSALFREFDNRVTNGTYPSLPPFEEIDFALLDEKEEWELVFSYIMEFPNVIKTSISELPSGIINIHYLVFFLGNLSSVFSVYYRRIKVLTESRSHLLPKLFARIYLLKSVQYVFHATLKLLNIDPIKEM